jgi:hypothetical protein
VEPQQPVFRKLRVFALDPGTAPQMGAAGVSEVVLSIAWEKLQPGPIGEYVKVIDENAAGRRLYDPVDLDDIAILAHDGLAPSDGNPKFHQQMVYAVAMQAIRTFEKALGRPIHWPQRATGYVKHIVIHPHYMPVMNAYYDPNKGKILFGYFEGNENAAVPGMIVFTCLSHDAIAHELSHPLLDAIPFSSGGEESDDVYALYEGLGDLLALLQRDSQPEFLRHQLALTRGDLAGPSQLGIVASQFGLGFGSQSGLRYAFGHYAEDGAWLPVKPDPRAFPATKQAHQRGELLLRAVFDALNRIYRSRVGDLLRIASEGTGVLPSGDLHPDLVNRLAYEAAKSATHVLGMCIRALDYCPKVGFTFGDYLRAIITADYDLVPTDPRKYRVAFAEAFRRFGIFPSGIGTMSIDTLLWPEVDPSSVMGKLVRKFILEMEADETGSPVGGDEPLHRREAEYALMERRRVQLQDYLAGDDKKMALLAGVDAARPFVYSIWPREHVGPQGESLSQWAIEIYQSSVRHEVSHTLLVDSATGLVSRALYRARGDAGRGGASDRRADPGTVQHGPGACTGRTIPAGLRLRPKYGGPDGDRAHQSGYAAYPLGKAGAGAGG